MLPTLAMNKKPLQPENIDLGVGASKKKFSNNSDPAPNLKNMDIFKRAFKATFAKPKP